MISMDLAQYLLFKKKLIKTITLENYHKSQTVVIYELEHCSFNMYLYRPPPTASLRNKITYPSILSLQFIFQLYCTSM